jgi:hypothetical protein
MYYKIKNKPAQLLAYGFGGQQTIGQIVRKVTKIISFIHLSSSVFFVLQRIKYQSNKSKFTVFSINWTYAQIHQGKLANSHSQYTFDAKKY